MTKKIYTISGFDCANCAAKAEAHISKQSDVEYAHLDFSTNKLYITFKDKPWDVDTLKNVVKEVEDDELFIAENGSLESKKTKIFNKRMWILLGRIFFAILITVLNLFAFAYNTPFFNWFRFGLYLLAVIAIGYDFFWKIILHIKNKANILDHNLLIFIASFGALTLSIIALIEGENSIKQFLGINVAMDESMESVMVIVLFQIGSIVESVATNKSKAAVMQAVELRVDTASKITENGLVTVKPEDLKIGDKIVITTGELVPIDGDVIDGEAFVDTSSLTGEYVPVKASKGTNVYSGCMIKSGSITVLVKKEYKDSTVNKILELISAGGEKKSKADEFIAKFAKIYTPIVVLVAILTLVVGGLITKNQWLTYIHTGLEILVIGCPCAIVISVPLAYFSAIGLGSKNGIVIKGSNYLDELARLGKLITDKTGTLTHGSFTIQHIVPNGVSEDELLDDLFAAECLSNHPIGKAICHGKNLKKVAALQRNFEEIAGFGTATTYKNHRIIAGNEKMMKSEKIQVEAAKEIGTVVYCAKDGKYQGYVVLSDVIKDDAQPMVDLLHKEKVEIILLTGDSEENAKDICEKLGIDSWHSKLLPEQKTKLLEYEMEGYKKAVAFIGDGINDAPSIIRSDIGIAMGGIGSDVAVENADIVIMNDDPAKVYDAMIIAKKARRTSLFNIIFALTIKVSVAVLAIIFKDAKWMMYVAVLADTGLTVLLVINSLLLLYRKIRRRV